MEITPIALTSLVFLGKILTWLLLNSRDVRCFTHTFVYQLAGSD